MKKEYEITISNDAFTDKNLINWKAVKYHTEFATIDEIMNFLKNGFCICSVFKNDNITQSEKTQNNFKETSIIYFDIDETKYKMSDYISLISVKPTIYYTTRNNGIKGNRFRLLYFVSTPIKSIHEYKQIYNSIASRLEEETNEIIKDKSSRSGVLNISGNAQRNIEYNITYKVYNHDDLKDIKSNPCHTENMASDNIKIMSIS